MSIIHVYLLSTNKNLRIYNKRNTTRWRIICVFFFQVLNDWKIKFKLKHISSAIFVINLSKNQPKTCLHWTFQKIYEKAMNLIRPDTSLNRTLLLSPVGVRINQVLLYYLKSRFYGVRKTTKPRNSTRNDSLYIYMLFIYRIN